MVGEVTPFYRDDWLSIYGGDCREVLRSLPSESVHCVVTSPPLGPYWGLRDYGVGGQLGLEATPEEYVAAMVAVFREVRRVLRADGPVSRQERRHAARARGELEAEGGRARVGRSVTRPHNRRSVGTDHGR